MTKKTYYVALYGVMFATILVAMTIDRLLSAFLFLSFAICCLTVTMAFVFVRNEWKCALPAGLMFGICSLVTAFIGGRYVFFNPLISVIPRFVVGFSAFGVYRLFTMFLRRVKSKVTRQYIALSIGAAAGALTNTFMVLTALRLFNNGDAVFTAFSIIAVTNFLPELLASTLLTPPIVLGVRRAMKYGVEAENLLDITDANQLGKEI
ncbi:MAG: hypothetical protein RRY18_00610 [Clostridia bacterium]